MRYELDHPLLAPLPRHAALEIINPRARLRIASPSVCKPLLTHALSLLVSPSAARCSAAIRDAVRAPIRRALSRPRRTSACGVRAVGAVSRAGAVARRALHASGAGASAAGLLAIGGACGGCVGMFEREDSVPRAQPRGIDARRDGACGDCLSASRVSLAAQLASAGHDAVRDAGTLRDVRVGAVPRARGTHRVRRTRPSPRRPGLVDQPARRGPTPLPRVRTRPRRRLRGPGRGAHARLLPRAQGEGPEGRQVGVRRACKGFYVQGGWLVYRRGGQGGQTVSRPAADMDSRGANTIQVPSGMRTPHARSIQPPPSARARRTAPPP